MAQVYGASIMVLAFALWNELGHSKSAKYLQELEIGFIPVTI